MNNVNEREFNEFFGRIPRGHGKSGYMEALAEYHTNPPAETTVGFKRLTDTAVVPTKAHPTDSGFDLYADETVIIEPGQTVVVKTGIAVVLPEGHEATVRPRSGITSRTKLRVQYGTVDNAYRGDIGIIVDNTHESKWLKVIRILAPYIPQFRRFGKTDCLLELEGNQFEDADAEGSPYKLGSYIIRKGDKLAQLVVSPVATFAGVEITDLDETDRGESGFGSTGVAK